MTFIYDSLQCVRICFHTAAEKCIAVKKETRLVGKPFVKPSEIQVDLGLGLT